MRAFDFLDENGPEAVISAAEAIRSAVDTLGIHPLIDRRVEGELRGSIISFGTPGYLAPYRDLTVADTILILEFRNQRESDYSV